jgi:hypothetical protein
MSGRFSLLSGVAWTLTGLSILMTLAGLALFLGGRGGVPFIIALSVIVYGLFGILISGAVQVVIAIYEKIAGATSALPSTAGVSAASSGQALAV